MLHAGGRKGLGKISKWQMKTDESWKLVELNEGDSHYVFKFVPTQY